MANKIQIEIRGDDKASAVVKQFARTFGMQLDRVEDKSERVGRSIDRLRNWTIALAGSYGLGRLATSFVDTGSRMDQLQLSLDTITHGEGEEWFRKLNEWALKMPINTEKAIQAFTNLRAMGLKPSIEDMTILVDTTSALGGSEDTMLGIARALGQMQTKGRASAEELMQLAERGIPAYEILQQQLGLTANQVANIGKEGIAGGRAVEALFKGMAERFGGMSAKMQDTWQGLTESLRSYWTEFQRLVMSSGVMDFIEAGLSTIVGRIDELKTTGRLDQWASQMGKGVVASMELIIKGAALVADAFYGWQGIWLGLSTGFATFAVFVNKGLDAMAGAIQGIAEFFRMESIAERVQKWRDFRIEFELWEKQVERNIKKLEELGQAGRPYTKAKQLIAEIKEEMAKQAEVADNVVIPSIERTGEKHQEVTTKMTKAEKEFAKIKEEAFKEEMARLDEALAQLDEANEAERERLEEHLEQMAEIREEARKEDLDRLQEAMDEQDTYIEQGLEQLAAANKKWTDRMAADFKGFSSRAQQAFSSVLVDAMHKEFKNIGDAFKAMADRMLDVFIDMIAQMLSKWAMSGLSSLFGLGGGGSAFAAVFGMHGGGVVGEGVRALKTIPRFHGGLAPSEYPAILQKGEGVFTKDQMRNMAPMPNLADLPERIANAIASVVGGGGMSVYVRGNMNDEEIADLFDRASSLAKRGLIYIKANESEYARSLI